LQHVVAHRAQCSRALAKIEFVGQSCAVDNDVRNKLRREVMSSHWEDLAPHQQRGALLLLAPALDLLDVAVAIAGDDKERVTALLKGGQLRRAGEADRARYEHDADEVSEVRFQFVIVQPWVLAQAL
jgi:hypothetical protein